MPDDTATPPEYDQAPARVVRAGRATVPAYTVDLDPDAARSALAGRGGRSAIDVLLGTDAAAAEPDDALADLLADDTPNVTDVDRDELTELHTWQRERARHKAAYDALGKDCAKRTAELLERRIERGWETLPATVSGLGEPVQAFIRGTLYPKFRVDPETGDKFTRTDVVPALQAAGLHHLLRTDYDGEAFAAHVRKAVTDWRAEAGETGVTDAEGRMVDAYGYPLTEAEAHDPTADALALHPEIREFIEPVLTEVIGFGKG